MNALDRLNNSVEEIHQKLDEILSQEKDIAQQEQDESAELQKLRKISSRLEDNRSEDIHREEIHDFAEAVELLARISVELDRTSEDLQSLIQELAENSSKEFEIVSNIAGEKIKLTSREKAEELAENISRTRKNESEIVEESRRARKEVKNAQEELEKLIKLEKFIEKTSEEKFGVEKAKDPLQKAEKRLQNAEGNLGEIPDKIEEVERNNEKVIEKIEQDTGMSRRKFLQGAGTVAAAGIVGLSGCSTGKKTEIPEETLRKFEASESQIRNLFQSYNERKGEMILDTKTLDFQHQAVEKDVVLIFLESVIKTSAEGPYSDLNSKISGGIDQDVAEDITPVFGIFLSAIAENFTLEDLANQNNGGLRNLELVIQSYQNKSRLKLELESGNEILREIINSNPLPEEAAKRVSDRIKAIPVV